MHLCLRFVFSLFWFTTLSGCGGGSSATTFVGQEPSNSNLSLDLSNVEPVQILIESMSLLGLPGYIAGSHLSAINGAGEYFIPAEASGYNQSEQSRADFAKLKSNFVSTAAYNDYQWLCPFGEMPIQLTRTQDSELPSTLIAQFTFLYQDCQGENGQTLNGIVVVSFERPPADVELAGNVVLENLTTSVPGFAESLALNGEFSFFASDLSAEQIPGGAVGSFIPEWRYTVHTTRNQLLIADVDGERNQLTNFEASFYSRLSVCDANCSNTVFEKFANGEIDQQNAGNYACATREIVRTVHEGDVPGNSATEYLYACNGSENSDVQVRSRHNATPSLNDDEGELQITQGGRDISVINHNQRSLLLSAHPIPHVSPGRPKALQAREDGV